MHLSLNGVNITITARSVEFSFRVLYMYIYIDRLLCHPKSWFLIVQHGICRRILPGLAVGTFWQDSSFSWDSFAFFHYRLLFIRFFLTSNPNLTTIPFNNMAQCKRSIWRTPKEYTTDEFYCYLPRFLPMMEKNQPTLINPSPGSGFE